MKTRTVTTYTVQELKEQFPDAFQHAHEQFLRDRESDELPWQGEIFDSLKAVCDVAGVTLRDWDLGLCNRSNGIAVSFPGEEPEAVEELSGKRAFAWLENNLFNSLRVRGNMRVDDWRKHVDSATGFLKRNAPLDKNARYYRTLDGKLHRREGAVGSIPSCPLTGVCFDEDYLDGLRKAIQQGDTLKEAFEGMADTYVDLLEKEYEATRTQEYFIEEAASLDMQFTEEGEVFE